MHAYIPSRTYFTPSTAPSVRTDSIRPTSLYVESDHHVTSGHLVAWSGNPSMFDNTGQRVSSFTATNGHEFALSSVSENSENRSRGVAGVVLERAAEPNAGVYTHKGVHGRHLAKNAQNILRVATKGSVVLAWVLDSHENTLDGVYTKNVNGVPTATAVVHQLGDFFTITDTEGSNSLAAQVATLTERLNALTSE